MLGARIIWIDSIANAGEMSLAELKAGKTADPWLAQLNSVSEATLITGDVPNIAAEPFL